MVKVGDRWVPEGFEDTEKLKFGLSFLTESAGLEKMTPQQSGALIRFLKAVDGVLDTIDQSKNAEELVAAAMAGAAGLALTAETLKGAFPNFGGGGFGPGGAPPGGPPFAGGGNPTPLPGIGPGPGALPGIVTTNPGALPGLTPQPKVPPGRTENWRINAGSKQRIDVIYMGKPTDTLKVAFGEPDAMEGPYWVYNGLKVRNIASGGTFTTVLFRIQAGKVTEVKAR